MQLPVALALFCEDIRQEKQGTDSLVGVMTDNITVPRLPVAAPKLAVYTRINLDPALEPGAVSYKLVLPNGSVIAASSIEGDLVEKARADARRDGNRLTSLITRLIISPFPVEEAGRVLMIVQIGDQELLAGSLNFKVAASASSETPEQAPTVSPPKAS